MAIHGGKTEPKLCSGQLIPRIYGRNELCPCGSGVKYKNCCL
ncbi:SEC-C metal-binding domain-containing protein [Pseudomonas syringae]